MGTQSTSSVNLDCGNHALPASTLTASDTEEPDEPPSLRAPSEASSVLSTLSTPTNDIEQNYQGEEKPSGVLPRLREAFMSSGQSPTYRSSFRALVMYSPINVLLVCIPLSFALYYTSDLHHQDVVLFVFSALGIIPLAGLLGLATEQVSLKTNDAVGGLVNASMGNVVELIVAAIGLRDCDIALVQSTLLGGLLSNLLLVLGMVFIVGGFRFHLQQFRPIPAQLNSSLMVVSVISMLVPTAFSQYLGPRLGNDEQYLLQMSRGAAIVLILIYAAYVTFQFYTHKDVFGLHHGRSLQATPSDFNVTDKGPSILPGPLANPGSDTRNDVPDIRLNTPVALGTLVVCTILAYFTAEHLVASLNGIVEDSGVSKEWLTLIVIPIVSNAAEHATAVVVAAKGKFELALTVAIGSCVQIALFVIPALVLVAWGLGKPLSLAFDPLETLCLLLSVLIVKFSVEDGRAHWLSGTALVGVYVLIAIAFWDYPEQTTPFVCA